MENQEVFKHLFQMSYDKFQKAMWLYVSEVAGPVIDRFVQERLPNLAGLSPNVSWSVDWRSTVNDGFGTTRSDGYTYIGLYGIIVIAVAIKLDYPDEAGGAVELMWCPYRHLLFSSRIEFFRDYYRIKPVAENENGVKYISPVAFLEMIEDELQGV